MNHRLVIKLITPFHPPRADQSQTLIVNQHLASHDNKIGDADKIILPKQLYHGCRPQQFQKLVSDEP